MDNNVFIVACGFYCKVMMEKTSIVRLQMLQPGGGTRVMACCCETCKFSWKCAWCRRQGWRSSVSQAADVCAVGMSPGCGDGRRQPHVAAGGGRGPTSSARRPACPRTKTRLGSRSPAGSRTPAYEIHVSLSFWHDIKVTANANEFWQKQN